MSLAASQRRDQRRRLVMSWNRSGSTTSPTVSEPRRLADYSPEALPEHQPSLATLLPVSLGGFTLAAVGMLLALAAAVGVGAWETVVNRPLFGTNATRFAATLAAARQCIDVRSLLSCGGWLAQVALAVATATALVVRQMRRHRRDDYRGRYRAWGWLAVLFTITACAGQVPLGGLVAAVASDATGITLGPDGMGWWVLTAGLLYATVGLWAVLPLHERTATGAWLVLSLAAWAAAAACGWVVKSPQMQPRLVHLVAGNVCWMAGGVLAAIAMLAAARSVLREVRGLSGRPAPRKEKASPARETSQPGRDHAAEAGEDAVARETDREAFDDAHDIRREEPVVFEAADDGDDEGERAGRHLSKAERKRLKKLARMGRAA
jgi:hypothetical protein